MALVFHAADGENLVILAFTVFDLYFVTSDDINICNGRRSCAYVCVHL